jgi:hypothetical protein
MPPESHATLDTYEHDKTVHSVHLERRQLVIRPASNQSAPNPSLDPQTTSDVPESAVSFSVLNTGAALAAMGLLTGVAALARRNRAKPAASMQLAAILALLSGSRAASKH